MSVDCLFCKIVRREVVSNVILDTPDVYAFEDINPQAPVHVLVVPKIHVPHVLDFGRDHVDLWQEMLFVVQKVSHQYSLDQEGFRLVTNMGPYGGQTIYHFHYHILGGRLFTWPPG